ncbi:energy transducer TonB [Comamonas fluminis]|uniref:energy transducer TonB n=1 Tax=Comamonas fluminis TaxID=2796366 RepID=UPI001C491333|nr:energy transducer TonB [Comamonas fluminis]
MISALRSGYRCLPHRPALALLLGMLWLGGCRQVPLKPEPPIEESAQRTVIDRSQVQQPVQPQPVQPQDAPAPIYAVPPTAGPRTTPSLVPQGSQQAPWISASERPAWLRDCLSSIQLDQPPQIQRTALPDYPKVLIDSNTEGPVVIIFQISETGQLGNYAVRPGAHPALVKASIQALRQWKFSPPTWQGKPVAACLIQAFRYKLQE